MSTLQPLYDLYDHPLDVSPTDRFRDPVDSAAERAMTEDKARRERQTAELIATTHADMYTIFKAGATVMPPSEANDLYYRTTNWQAADGTWCFLHEAGRLPSNTGRMIWDGQVVFSTATQAEPARYDARCNLGPNYFFVQSPYASGNPLGETPDVMLKSVQHYIDERVMALCIEGKVDVADSVHHTAQLLIDDILEQHSPTWYPTRRSDLGYTHRRNCRLRSPTGQKCDITQWGRQDGSDMVGAEVYDIRYNGRNFWLTPEAFFSDDQHSDEEVDEMIFFEQVCPILVSAPKGVD